MEGLPNTSATKMIDYWLILCQLVPFAQVVLLTAMEFLREEEKGESQVVEHEESQLALSTNARPKPKESSLKKHPRSSLVPGLAMIGMLFFIVVPRYFCVYKFSFS